jgi:ribosomal protein L22
MAITLTKLVGNLQNTRETAQAIRGLSLRRAQRYLKDVIAHKQVCSPTTFTRTHAHKHTQTHIHCMQHALCNLTVLQLVFILAPVLCV